MTRFTALWISGIAVLISACTSSTQQVFPEDLPTIKQIYQQHMATATGDSNARAQVQRTVHNDDQDLQGEASIHYQQLKQQFALLHNPVVMVYVFPHLTAAGTPIPGYVTYFTLYSGHPVALPGEVSEAMTERQRVSASTPERAVPTQR